MIFGIGTDILDVARMEEALAKNSRFLERFFSEREQAMIRERGARSIHAAAVNFAGKEAVSKALGTGIGREVRLEEIEILRKDSGAPYVNLTGGTLRFAEACGVGEIFVSLSDTETLASAYAVAEKKDSSIVS